MLALPSPAQQVRLAQLDQRGLALLCLVLQDLQAPLVLLVLMGLPALLDPQERLVLTDPLDQLDQLVQHRV